jgi:hypothetical protein
MPKRYDKALFKKLYDAGCIDRVIAERTGAAKGTVINWRKSERLPPNQRVSPDERYGLDLQTDRESIFCDKDAVEDFMGFKNRGRKAEPLVRRKKWWYK